MLRIALTGGIACGKSLAGTYFERLGFAVCDADRVAHDVMRPGLRAHAEIVQAFGSGILSPDGSIDRIALGNRVFADREELERLNRIVHPRVREAVDAWLAEEARDRPALVILPLLFEAGMERGWDAVVCITSREQTQMRRLRARGLDEGRARQRLAAQWPVDEKAARSDYVLNNDGTEAELEAQVGRLAGRLLER